MRFPLESEFQQVEEGASVQSDSPSPAKLDFAAICTIISAVYSGDAKYYDFSVLDGNPNERQVQRLGEGSVFAVHKADIRHKVASWTDFGIFESEIRNAVFKRTESLFDSSGRSLPGKELKIQSFMKEIQILSHKPLSLHPNIIKLQGIAWHCEQFTESSTIQPQIVLDAANTTLRSILKNDLPFETRLQLAIDIANGVHVLHHCGVVHGDIKPENILLKEESVPGTSGRPSKQYAVKIADFSHSLILEDVPRRYNIGTKGYQAPEMQEGMVIDKPTALDLWALGITLWEIFGRSRIERETTALEWEVIDETERHPLLIEALTDIAVNFEGIANEERRVHVSGLLRASLSRRPEKRDLATIQRALDELFYNYEEAENESRTVTRNERPKMPSGARLVEINTSSTLYINYQALNTAPGHAKDQLFASLDDISKDETDLRRPRALHELGVCLISKFGDPNKSNSEEAFQYFRQAAELGDTTSKGFIRRLGYLQPNKDEHLRRRMDQWTFEAAVNGNQAAFEDLTNKGSNKAEKGRVLESRVAQKFPVRFSIDDSAEFQGQWSRFVESHESGNPSLNPQDDSVLHWAAYLNLTEHIRYLVGTMGINMDRQNQNRETPLITACSNGNLEAALVLLEHGADVNVKTVLEENCLHFIWRFTDEDALKLLPILQAKGIDFNAKASSPDLDSMDTFYKMRRQADSLPVLRGLAIERVAARGRGRLLSWFLTAGSPPEIVNGNLIRRMLCWAAILSFPEVGEVLICHTQQSQNNGQQWNSLSSQLPPIGDTIWEHEGHKKGFMDAAAQGWLSTRKGGWSTTEVFWRICCHGHRWEDNLQATIAMLSTRFDQPLCRFQDAILRAMDRRSLGFLRIYLDQCIQDHGDTGKGHACSLPASSNQEAQSEPDQSKVVDMICSHTGTTLVQLSVILGYREMFKLLAWQFSADVGRLWSPSSIIDRSPLAGLKSHEIQNANCYIVLALHSKDMWFAYEFQQLGFDHTPSGVFVQTAPETYYNPEASVPLGPTVRLPALLCSLDQGFYHLTSFLLNRGARMDEQVRYKEPVLEQALSPLFLSRGTIQFLFGNRGLYRQGNGHMELISPSLMPHELFKEGNGYHSFRILMRGWHGFFNNDRRARYLIPGGLRHVGQELLHEGIGAIVPWLLFAVAYLVSAVFGWQYYTALIPLYTVMRNRAGLPSDHDADKHTKEYPGGFHNIHERILQDAWEELFIIFQHPDLNPPWHKRTQSLLSLTIMGDITYKWAGATFFSFFTASHWTVFHKSYRPLRNMNPLLAAIIRLHQRQAIKYEPSLVEILFWSDYDLLVPGSDAATEFHKLGFRYSLFHFWGVLYPLHFAVLLYPLVLVAVSMHFGIALVIPCGVIMLSGLIIFSIERFTILSTLFAFFLGTSYVMIALYGSHDIFFVLALVNLLFSGAAALMGFIWGVVSTTAPSSASVDFHDINGPLFPWTGSPYSLRDFFRALRRLAHRAEHHKDSIDSA